APGQTGTRWAADASRSRPGHLGGEDVTLIADGADQFLAAGAVVELLAQPAAHQVESPAGEGAARAQLPVRRARLLPAAQDRADAGQELARIARLGQIVVGAEFETDDAVGLLAHGAQHDDGRAVRAGDPAADGEPI